MKSIVEPLHLTASDEVEVGIVFVSCSFREGVNDSLSDRTNL